MSDLSWLRYSRSNVLLNVNSIARNEEDERDYESKQVAECSCTKDRGREDSSQGIYLQQQSLLLLSSLETEREREII
jgi:hypothetical protein